MSSITTDNCFWCFFYKKDIETICYIHLISGTASTSCLSHIYNNNLYPES